MEEAIVSISAQEDILESEKNIAARFSAASSGLESRIWEIRGFFLDTCQMTQTVPNGVGFIIFLFIWQTITFIDLASLCYARRWVGILDNDRLVLLPFFRNQIKNAN